MLISREKETDANKNIKIATKFICCFVCLFFLLFPDAANSVATTTANHEYRHFRLFKLTP